MDTIKARGLIIKQNDWGEGHRMLTVFTEEYGIIKAASYGAGRMKSAKAAATQFLTWGTFELYTSGSGPARVNSVLPEETFFPIQEDIEKLSLAVYMADLAIAALQMQNPDERALRLFLNVLYALAYRGEDTIKAKAAYEIRLMGYAGFYPQLDSCIFCGSTEVAGFSDKGGAVCPACFKKGMIPLDEAAHAALSYILNCPEKKILSFSASPKLCRTLSEIGEKYCRSCLELEMKSLAYFKAMHDTYK